MLLCGITNVSYCQKYAVKTVQMFRRPLSLFSYFSPCQRCIQIKSTKNVFKATVSTQLLAPPITLLNIRSQLFSKAFKDKLFDIGIQLPEKFKRGQLEKAAKVLLNGVYMKVPYKTLRETAGLEDSFLMWLRIVYIHLWILTCQLNRGGRDGRMIVALMVKYLHEDINVRLGKFENELKMRVKSRDVLKTASVELNLFFVLLDEGLLSSDAILASALWSLVYSINSYEAEIWHIENLVHYIRLTSERMQDINFESFVLDHENINWEFPKSLLTSIEEENRKWSDSD